MGKSNAQIYVEKTASLTCARTAHVRRLRHPDPGALHRAARPDRLRLAQLDLRGVDVVRDDRVGDVGRLWHLKPLSPSLTRCNNVFFHHFSFNTNACMDVAMASTARLRFLSLSVSRIFPSFSFGVQSTAFRVFPRSMYHQLHVFGWTSGQSISQCIAASDSRVAGGGLE